MNSYQAARLYMAKEAALPALAPTLARIGNWAWKARTHLPAFLRTGKAGVGLRHSVNTMASGYGRAAQTLGNVGMRWAKPGTGAGKFFGGLRGYGDRMLNAGLRQQLRADQIWSNPSRWSYPLRHWSGIAAATVAPPAVQAAYWGPWMVNNPATGAAVYGPGLLGKLGGPKPPPVTQQVRR